MKAQHRLGLILSWPWLTAVFLVDIAVLVTGSQLPNPRVALGVAGLLTIISLVTYRGISPVAALTAWAWDWSSAPEATLVAGAIPAIDHHRRFSRHPVGVQEYQGQVVALIAVATPAGLISTSPEATLPVTAVAAGLRQFDVQLDAIDIVSVWMRPSAEPVDQPDPVMMGDRPADRGRSTWLVLRLDTWRNVAAVAARDSLASTLAVVAEQLAQDLQRRTCTAQLLTGAEIAEVPTAVLAGLQPAWSRPGWRHLKYSKGYATSFWVSPHDITSETLDRLWLPDTDATVLTVRVATRDLRTEVSAWVRYHSSERLHRDVRTGLNPLTARQLAAVRASLPAPRTRLPLVVPAKTLRYGEQLAVPLGPVQKYSASPVGSQL